jgi:hypothetical protein
LKGFNDLSTTHPAIAKRLVNPADGFKYAQSSPKILEWKCTKGHTFKARVDTVVKSPRDGCSFCHGTSVLVGFNDLATTHPKIAMELNKLDPTKFTRGSGERVEWKCSKGHIWNATIGSRTSNRSGCPFCSQTKFKEGFNDLKTLEPQLAQEAFKWNPSKFSRGAKIKKKWKCPRNHIYEATISDRAIKKSGCPYCAGNSVLKGFNDLATTHRDLVKEVSGWDPSKVIAGSGKPLSWKCQEGHIWKASPQSRALKGTGCPTCSKSGFDPNEKGYLYFLIHPVWEMYQIGITNNPSRRLASHAKLGWQVVELRGPTEGHLVQEWETAMLRMLRSKGANLGKPDALDKFDGYSEAWSISSFQASSIPELMRMTEEFEQGKSRSKSRNPRV